MKSVARTYRLLLAVFSVFAINAAQAAVLTSNLAETPSGNYTADFSGPEAEAFTTDASGGTLASVSISIVGVNDASGNFTLRIFSDNAGVPGSMVPGGLLTGPSNPSVGINTYTAPTPLTLAASTRYWVVAQVSSGTGAYDWGYTNSANQTGPWTIEDFEAYSSNAGSTWNTDVGVLQMSVSDSVSAATAIPTLSEAGMIILSGLLALGAFVTMRRREQR